MLKPIVLLFWNPRMQIRLLMYASRNQVFFAHVIMKLLESNCTEYALQIRFTLGTDLMQTRQIQILAGKNICFIVSCSSCSFYGFNELWGVTKKFSVFLFKMHIFECSTIQLKLAHYM